MSDGHYREQVSAESYRHAEPPTNDGSGLAKIVAASVLTRSGEPYFDSLLRLLSAQFEVRLGLVAALDRTEQGVVESVVLFEEGQRGANIRYALLGTPCESIFSPSQVCVYTHGVTDLFPNDQILDEVGAVGYAGMPLFCRDGEMIGLIALCTGAELKAPDEVAALLKVFGHRSSLELEHLLALRRAHESAKSLDLDGEHSQTSLSEFIRKLDCC